MAQEIEAKYRIADPTALRGRLVARGARPAARVLEASRLFDTADQRLRQADCGLRVRTCRALDQTPDAAATLTYKGPRAAGPPKIREEIETAVSDPFAIVVTLQRLGFQEVLVYEKRRERWQLGACEVCLDELPRLGWFVEIEGPNAASVASAARALDLEAEPALRETYVELAAGHGTTSPQGVTSLRFDQ
jgi:adenylate cyclase class 2